MFASAKIYNRDVNLAGQSRLLKGEDVLIDENGNIVAPIADTLTSGHTFVGNASNVSTDTALSGDVTLSNTGVVTIANNAVSTAKLAANAVTTAKITDANVTLAKLSVGVAPAFVAKYGGSATDGVGGTSFPITITGALATDLGFCSIQASDNPVEIQKVTMSNNAMTVLVSGASGAITLNYVVFRAAA